MLYSPGDNRKKLRYPKPNVKSQTDTMEQTYNPAEIEAQAQSYWQENQSFEVKEDLSHEKFYCLSMLPYPSGELHMGHVRNYTIGDVISRYQRMKGMNVLQPMGWDAFGLPAENAAIQHQLAPAEWTRKNIDQMREQLKRLGFAIDWKREFKTCDPDYYVWEQWLFTKLVKKGLAYQKEAEVNWDPVDQTVLANEQIVNGRGWRSGALVERRKIKQWFLKITDYADELLEELDNLTGWPDQVRTMQRNWIGRSEGVSLDFKVKDSDEKLRVFTTRTDTLLGATYMAISPNHPLAIQAASNSDVQKFIASCQHTKVAEAEIATMEKRGIDSGFKAIHPISHKEIPIWIANYVLMEYGSGAVMAVPAHDERDFEFAQKYGLPIQPVIKPTQDNWDFSQAPYTEYGVTYNSEQFDNLSSADAIDAITEFLKDTSNAVKKTHYRLRDWGVSRQRYWGAPIPIIHCDECGAVPVPEKDLPVLLPEDVVLKEPGSPLKNIPEFYNVACPCCGKDAHRETDTFDTFMESSWYYARYCCSNQHETMLDDRAKYWTPVDQYIGGIEHAVMHLLYARFMHKILRDEGLVNSPEPFTNLLTQGMVLKDGAKMSKSKGNTVSPDELIKNYGADTVRLFTIFASPPEQSLEWSDSGVEGAFKFLKRVWNLTTENQEILIAQNKSQSGFDFKEADDTVKKLRKELHEILQQANQDIERLQLNTTVSASMKIFNLISDINTDEESHAALLHEAVSILLRLLCPITPHICHHLWRLCEFGDDVSTEKWPKVDSRAMRTDTIDLVVQVNGKRRGQIQVPVDANNEQITELATKDENIAPHLSGKTYKKVIVVPNRLINIVV